MKICADICNGSKHYFLKTSRSNEKITVVPVVLPIEQNKIKEPNVIFCINGHDYDPLSLATDCIKKWDEFLET